MSWFDKLFGEDNDSNEDILRNKNKDARQINRMILIMTHYCHKIMISIIVQKEVSFPNGRF